jgi:hypothetical protein
MDHDEGTVESFKCEVCPRSFDIEAPATRHDTRYGFARRSRCALIQSQPAS